MGTNRECFVENEFKDSASAARCLQYNNLDVFS